MDWRNIQFNEDFIESYNEEMEEHGDITDSDYNLQKEFVKILK